MDYLFLHIAAFIAQHHSWAAMILGAATLLESLALIGAFIPATALMVMAGGLLAAGVLDPVAVIAWCLAGAIVGNAITYIFGRRLGGPILRHRWFVNNRRMIARTRLFMRHHGVASIFIGRFFGPLRGFVPLVAGVIEMRQRRFHIANAVSGLVWVLVMLAPGYYAARGLAKLEALGDADVVTICLVVVVALAAGAFGVWRWMQYRAAKRQVAAVSRTRHVVTLGTS